MLDWFALRGDYSKYLREIRFTLYDDYRFATSFSQTGYAAGLQNGKYITASIYDRSFSLEYPTDAPPHTVRTVDGGWNYGIINGGIGLSVLGHELDHLIGIGH